MTPGWYGKLPALGDFASRRLPPAFTHAWDHWLQEVVAGSKAILGDAWLNTYLTSDIWRFVITAGCLTPQAWAGVMLPSVDRVGRYYPLCIAAPLSTQTASPSWFAALDQCAHLALQARELEQFETALMNMAFPAAEEDSEQTRLLAPATTQETENSISIMLNNGLAGQSLWFVETASGPRHERLHTGMPDTVAYTHMLQGI